MENIKLAERVVEKLTGTLGRIMDVHSLKQYILTVLGYKFVSFLVEEELKKLNIPLETITDEEVIKYREEIIKNLGVFILPSDRFEMLLDKSIEEIQDAINKANESTKGTKLDGIFSLIEIDSLQLGVTRELREERIKAIIKEIRELPLSTDIVSNVYELLLKEFAKINTAEYFTPTEVSKLLSEIVTTEVEDIKTIYDCACGSGNLLTQLAKKLNGQGVQVYGQEINKITHNLCKINLLLSGVEVKNINIAIGDTLTEAKHTGIKMDAIVANPPYSLKWVGKDDKSLLENAIYKDVGVLPPKKASDLCFVLHSLHTLSDKGKMAIVLPLGILYRGGSEGKIRKYLVDNNYIEAVIELPSKIFLNTDISTAILVLRKNKVTTDVLFIDASKEYTECGKRNVIEEQHINNILECYRNGTKQKSNL